MDYQYVLQGIAGLLANHLKQIHDYAAANPDDPIIEYNSHDITPEDYQQLTKKNMVFADMSSGGQLTFGVWLPQSIKAVMGDAFPCKDGVYQAHSISLEKAGLFIEGDNRYFHIEAMPYALLNQAFVPDDFVLKGQECFDCAGSLTALWIAFDAENYAIAAYRNPNLLNCIRDEKPYLLKHQTMQKVLSELFISNQIPQPRKRTRTPDVTQDLLELYHWVYWYRQKGETLETACFQAVENHPKLVPDKWKEAFATLEKRVIRMDKYPAISQV